MNLIVLKPSKMDTKSTVQPRQWKYRYFLNLTVHHETNSQVSLALQVLPSTYLQKNTLQPQSPWSMPMSNNYGTHLSVSWKYWVILNVDWKEDLSNLQAALHSLMFLCKALQN